MLIYVHKPTSSTAVRGLLINTVAIQKVEPKRFHWASREDGSKITFTNGDTLVVTNPVEEIKKASEGR